MGAVRRTLGQRIMGTTPSVTSTEKRPSTSASDADCNATTDTSAHQSVIRMPL